MRLTDCVPHQDRESPLIHCIKIQNEGAVDVMMRCKIDPNACNSRGVTPISAAAHKGYVPIMRLLIDAGAFVNAVNQSGSTALIQVGDGASSYQLYLESHTCDTA